MAPAVQPRPAPLATIATALGVAVSIVHTHVLKTFNKTGVHRRGELGGLLAAFSSPLT
jgi:DNA-binding CsgD family transcriptional regulator